MKIKIKSIYLLASTMLMFMVGCGNKDYYIPHTYPDGRMLENPGQAIVSMVSGANIDQNAAEILALIPTTGQIMGKLSVDVPRDLQDGPYLMAYISNLQGLELSLPLTIDNLNNPICTPQVSLPLLSDNGEIPQAPDVFGALGNVRVLEDSIARLSLKPQPLTKLIECMVVMTGIESVDLKELIVTIDGVSRSCSFDRNNNAKGVIVKNENNTSYFVKSSFGGNSNSINGVIRLFGIDENRQQQMTFNVIRQDGTEMEFQEDITEHIKNFNDFSTDLPFKFTITLGFSVNGITGSIKPWLPGWEDEEDAI